MAFITGPVWRLTVELQDLDKNKSRTAFYYAQGEIFADVLTHINTRLLPAMAGIVDSAILGYTLTLTGENDAPIVPLEPSDVERKGSFSFEAVNGQRTRVEVPSVKSSLVTDYTNVILATDPLVAAFIIAMTIPDVNGVAPTAQLGGYLDTFRAPARKIHRDNPNG